MIIAVSGLTEDAQGNKGSAGAGKDEVADHLVRKHGFVKIAFADEIKRIAMRLWDFSEEQLWGPSEERNKPDKRYPFQCRGCQTCEFRCDHYIGFLTPRHALQQIGTEVARAIDPDVWVRFALNVADQILNGPSKEDARFVSSAGKLERRPMTWCARYDRTKGVTGGWGEGQPAKGVVISDLRFKNEKAGVGAVGGKNWRKMRKVATLPGHGGKHASETGLLDVPDAEFDGIFPDGDLNHCFMLIDSVMDVYSGRILPYDPAQADVPPFLRKK